MYLYNEGTLIKLQKCLRSLPTEIGFVIPLFQSYVYKDLYFIHRKIFARKKTALGTMHK